MCIIALCAHGIATPTSTDRGRSPAHQGMMCAGAPVNGLCLRGHCPSSEMTHWVISRHTSTHARAGAPVPYSCAGSRPAQECPVYRRTSACALVRQCALLGLKPAHQQTCAGALTMHRVVCALFGAPAQVHWCTTGVSVPNPHRRALGLTLTPPTFSL